MLGQDFLNIGFFRMPEQIQHYAFRRETALHMATAANSSQRQWFRLFAGIA
jgi:hypothetical protein